MSLNLNVVHLAGRLTRDVELRDVGTTKVAKFSLAINHRYKDKSGEKQEEVTYIDVSAWGKTGELVAQYLHKGSPCYVEGRLTLDAWKTKNGEPRQSITVTASSVQFLGEAKRGDNMLAEPAMAAQAAAVSSNPVPPTIDDEPPF